MACHVRDLVGYAVGGCAGVGWVLRASTTGGREQRSCATHRDRLWVWLAAVQEDPMVLGRPVDET
ncbi:MAG: hypothetical protein L3K23_10515, partial [Thermoplasmata archaeon]|nr:hypothetical protein [Thermoplasmata archaeon]